ncbi:MAG: hypothetical protein ACREMB_27780 [Candidatus Rokuibacteriota bacterium]
MPRQLAPELREFIYRYCSTVPALEAMVLVQGRPDAVWTAESLQAELRHPEAADLLAALHWQGLLSAGPDGTYRFAPGSDELRRLAESLGRAYASDRVAVVEEVASLKALAPIRKFADAFRIKRDG